MKKNSALKKLLQNYPLLGAACFASAANAQIIYTNIPDTTFGPNETCYLDLNNDGTADFKIINHSNSVGNTWYELAEGILHTNGTDQVLDYGFFAHKAKNLSDGDTISSNM